MSTENVNQTLLEVEDMPESGTELIAKSVTKESQKNTESFIIPQILNSPEKLDDSRCRSEQIFNQQTTYLTRKSRKKDKQCFKCMYEDCNFASYSEAEVSVHIAHHQLKGETYECIPCNLKFLKKGSQHKHSLSHLKDSKRLIGCEFPGCSKRYTTIYNRDVNII